MGVGFHSDNKHVPFVVPVLGIRHLQIHVLCIHFEA